MQQLRTISSIIRSYVDRRNRGYRMLRTSARKLLILRQNMSDSRWFGAQFALAQELLSISTDESRALSHAARLMLDLASPVHNAIARADRGMAWLALTGIYQHSLPNDAATLRHRDLVAATMAIKHLSGGPHQRAFALALTLRASVNRTLVMDGERRLSNAVIADMQRAKAILLKLRQFADVAACRCDLSLWISEWLAVPEFSTRQKVQFVAIGRDNAERAMRYYQRRGDTSSRNECNVIKSRLRSRSK